MLSGIKIQDIIRFPDERGIFSELYRDDWKNFVSDDKIVQANLSITYPGMIRAWHRHHRGQVDYFITIKGTTKICAYDGKPDSQTYGQLNEIISSEDRIQCIRIPGFYFHGFKSLGYKPAYVIYLTTKLYDYQNPDEERKAWNDPSIIDPKTNKPYDWNAFPHK